MDDLLWGSHQGLMLRLWHENDGLIGSTELDLSRRRKQIIEAELYYVILNQPLTLAREQVTLC
jgi:hypothetical protein